MSLLEHIAVCPSAYMNAIVDGSSATASSIPTSICMAGSKHFWPSVSSSSSAGGGGGAGAALLAAIIARMAARSLARMAAWISPPKGREESGAPP